MRASTICFMLAATLADASLIKPSNPQQNREREFPDRCYPDPCKGVTYQNSTAVCGDPRLGPKVFPKDFPLANELQTYSRIGDLCPYEFLEKWTVNASNPQAYWIYPDDSGFTINTEDLPIQGNMTLPVGQKLDRFGSEYGTFMAPLGAPYIERSLPPSNLFAPENSSFPYNYHVYEVTKEFVALVGPIAPWFEQPGFGAQLMVPMKVLDLIDQGFLKRLETEDYDEADEYSADYLPDPPQPTSS